MTEDYFDSGDEIYDDLDSLFVHKPTTSCGSMDDACTCISSKTALPSETWMDERDILVLPVSLSKPEEVKDVAIGSEQNAGLCHNPYHQDAKLRKMEMDLYVELMAQDINERESKSKHTTEYENLRKEVIRLRNLNSEKDTMLSELKIQNMNLKKNICSLYKTAKAEVDQKNILLQEANEMLDNIRYHRNLTSSNDHQTSVSHNERCSESGKNMNTKGPNHKFNDKNESSAKNRDERQRSHLLKKRKLSSSPSKVDPRPDFNKKHSRKEENNLHTQKSSASTHNDAKTLQVDSESIKNSRDMTETNNIFFNILPDTLRKSFLEYEQNQIVSLNKLKQSFVNNYFTYCKNTPMNNVISPIDSVQVSKTETIDNHLVFLYDQGNNLRTQNTKEKAESTKEKAQSIKEMTQSANEKTQSTKEACDTSFSIHHNLHERIKHSRSNMKYLSDGETCSEDSSYNDTHRTKPINVLSAELRKDVVNLFRYKKQKLPFLVKRKLGFYDKSTKKKQVTTIYKQF